MQGPNSREGSAAGAINIDRLGIATDLGGGPTIGGNQSTALLLSAIKTAQNGGHLL